MAWSKLKPVFAAAISVALLTIHASARADAVYRLIEGQWAESGNEDPFGDRPLQLWLPVGTLLYDVRPSFHKELVSRWKYRNAITHTGYPIHIKAQETRSDYNFKRLEEQPLQQRIYFMQPVLCPGSTNPIAWPNRNCLDGRPMGEGWTFDFEEAQANLSKDYLIATGILSEATLDDLGLPREAMSFRLSRHELETFEKKGLVLRLDRRHPTQNFRFVDSFYFPCNTTRSNTVQKEDVNKAYVEAGAGAGFDFFTWLSAKIETGVSHERNISEAASETTEVTSSESSVYQTWGLMIDRTEEEKVEIPYFIEKSFDCRAGRGSNSPGDRIRKVTVKFWNDRDDRDDVLEFSDSTRWVTMTDDIYRYFQRPIFFSVNTEYDQALVIERIMQAWPRLSYNQALFIFAQLNNTCPSADRRSCIDVTSAAEAH